MRKLRSAELPRISPEEYQRSHKMPVTVVLDNIRSLLNVGSFFRTSDSFRVEKIVLCGFTGCPPQAEIHKSALGAEEVVPWEYQLSAVDALLQLKHSGYEAIAVEHTSDSKPLNEFFPDKERKYALVFGNEVRGVQTECIEQCSMALEIPMSGTKHSLNVSTCAGIVLWHFYQHWRVNL
jgi:tRNA G18 (ribose-2'-O)-methylase SpoU